ncbi:30S ribosomal protein S5 [Candidatus Micrarchaeota archaeon CG1_02_55_22]|nr:MAG: 30S ribosomal protein S5 [Candidatus Micrarchaeota archaeon CG1_02_55_22]
MARRSFGKPVERSFDAKDWNPKTALGRKIKSGEITSLEEILSTGARILEPEVVDALLPDLREEVLEVTSTQRMTAYGRKMQMRAVVVVGDSKGFVGAGVGKAADTRDAIAEALKSAKKNIIHVRLGNGSWEETGAGESHSLEREAVGRSSSTKIVIKPAPRGVGIVANKTSKSVLKLAGVKDAWTFTNGRTRNILNMVLATMNALDTLNRLKMGSSRS